MAVLEEAAAGGGITGFLRVFQRIRLKGESLCSSSRYDGTSGNGT